MLTIACSFACFEDFAELLRFPRPVHWPYDLAESISEFSRRNVRMTQRLRILLPSMHFQEIPLQNECKTYASCFAYFAYARCSQPPSRWWKARLGKCYFQMGMYRDAEKQFKSAIKEEDTVALLFERSTVVAAGVCWTRKLL